MSAIRSGDWKLLHYYEDRHVELYDLGSDPGEKNDLAKERRETVKQLSAKLASWLNRTKAQFPAENPAKKKGKKD